MKIRFAKEDEYFEIDKLFQELHRLHINFRPELYKNTSFVTAQDEFSKYVKNKLILVAEIDKKIVGCLYYYFQKKENELNLYKRRKVIFICFFYVDENFRRKGIGSSLFSEILRIAEENNVDSVELQVDSKNEYAKEFYKAIGFSEKIIKMEYKMPEKREIPNKSQYYEPQLTSMRVYVTEKCNASCPNCFNAKSRSNVEMSIEDFEKLCGYLKSNGIKRLKMLGGEPTVHDSFEKMFEIAQKYFEGVAIFSNGIEDKIKNIKLREKDAVVYNFLFNKELSEERFHLENGGTRSLEIQVHKDTDEIALASRILELVNINREKIHFALTLDCTSNIFEEKDILVPKLQFLEKTFFENNLNFSYDHKMPFCYLYKTDLHPNNTGSCDVETAGVIDSKLNLRFCLQNPDLLINLYQDGKFIPWQILMNYLYKRYYELRLESLNKICLNCVFFNHRCNGGCWIPKNKISKDDILNNTEFPTI